VVSSVCRPSCTFYLGPLVIMFIISTAASTFEKLRRIDNEIEVEEQLDLEPTGDHTSAASGNVRFVRLRTALKIDDSAARQSGM